MNIKIGVIGGGQLCRMMGEEIQRKGLPFELTTLDPTRECPALPYVKKHIIGDFKDSKKIRELSDASDIITYEIELANGRVLEDLAAEGKEIHPSPETLRTVQDKYTQASFLQSNNIPVPDFREITNKKDVGDVAKSYGLPLMIKARTDSYDGRGNFLLTSLDQVDEVFSEFHGRKLMAQKYIDFEREVSVIAARSTTGEVKTYPVGENIHVDNILHTTIVPARLSEKVAYRTREIAEKTLYSLKGAGVFGIEMFVDKHDEVLINEIAPRVHNSGHYTIEGCQTSQFEQHLRAISGMPLGNTDLIHNEVVMHNILGDTNNGYSGQYDLQGFEKLANAPGVFVHMYGKTEVRNARKMGHFTIVHDKMAKDRESLLKEASDLRTYITFKPFT